MIIKQIVIRTDELISEYKEYIFQVGKKCRSLYQDHNKRNEERKIKYNNDGALADYFLSLIFQSGWH